MNGILLVFLITFAAFLLNLPFGFLRYKTKRLSAKWFLYIHLPIPFIYVLRTIAGVGYQIIPIIAVGAILGQLVGGRINNLISAKASRDA
ncbi:MAG: hypothetical protein HY886_10110 [Deltaproteobacteria bacterium]|nr:hypothetical protein [Deltaproteobacteria bacterium]